MEKKEEILEVTSRGFIRDGHGFCSSGSSFVRAGWHFHDEERIKNGTEGLPEWAALKP